MKKTQLLRSLGTAIHTSDAVNKQGRIAALFLKEEAREFSFILSQQAKQVSGSQRSYSLLRRHTQRRHHGRQPVI